MTCERCQKLERELTELKTTLAGPYPGDHQMSRIEDLLNELLKRSWEPPMFDTGDDPKEMYPSH